MNPKYEVTITGRRLELTDAIKNRVNEMCDKLYEHDDKIDSIRVELEVERHATTHRDEFLAKAQLDERRDHFRASARGDDLYSVIGDLEQILDRALRRNSRRRVTQRKRINSIDLLSNIPKSAS